MEFDGRDLGTGTYVNLSIGLLLNVMWRLKGPWCFIVPNHPFSEVLDGTHGRYPFLQVPLQEQGTYASICTMAGHVSGLLESVLHR